MTPQRKHTAARSRGFVRIQQMTFGELVKALEACYQDAEVRFTFGLHPLLEPEQPPFHYYHGYHDNVAIGHTDQGAPPTVEQMLDAIRPWLNTTIPSEFDDLLIDQEMPLWVGHDTTADTALVGVTEDPEYNIVLLQTWAIT